MLSILNTLNIGLAESRREIGTLLAIGYKARQVAFIYTMEAFFILCASLLLGGIAALFLQHGIIAMQLPFQLPGFSNASTFQLTPAMHEYLLCAGGVALLVLIATFAATRRYASHSVLTLLDPGA
jgi:ABC-type lipoprotein release transport system permease subunit